MNKPLNKTCSMLLTLLRRDWILLIVWLVGVLAFAASGAGKFEAAMSTPSLKTTMFAIFQNPAMIGLFGPSKATAATTTVGSMFGQTMALMTSLVFAVVAIIYVIDRTRKEEDEGITELLRSFQVGKLARTTAVVIELFVLQVLISLVLAASIQVQNVPSMTDFSHNLLFAATIGAQGFLWGIVALVCAQIFSDAGSAKGVTFGIFGILYIIRMGTDIQNVNLGWFNPISWSYLTWVYVDNDWLPLVLTVVLALILLLVAYLLEIGRDVSAGYVRSGDGRAQAPKSLLSIQGLVFHEERGMLIGWLIGLFVGGIMYGSMFGQMGSFLKNSTGLMKQLLSVPGYQTSMINQFLVTIFSIGGVLIACFGVLLFSKMISEERKNRQEQLYATTLGRPTLYFTYIFFTLIATALAQFLFSLGMWLAQAGNKSPISFAVMMKSSFVYLPAVWFVIGLVALLIAFLPRLTGLIWIYLAFAFLMSYIGKMLRFPDWVNDISVFHQIPELPVAKMNWTNVTLVTIFAVIFIVVGVAQYRRRDLIGG